jgi:hypothetical protein
MQPGRGLRLREHGCGHDLVEQVGPLEQAPVAGRVEDDHLLLGCLQQLEPFVGEGGSASGWRDLWPCRRHSDGRSLNAIEEFDDDQVWRHPTHHCQRGPRRIVWGPLTVLALLVVVNGLGEETGWRGFLQPTPQRVLPPRLAILAVAVRCKPPVK